VVKIVWPFGYSAVPDGGQIALLDETGRVLARTGDYVSIGGGDMPDGSYNGCGGVTVVGPDGSSPPNPTASPPGSPAGVEYVHLDQALATAQEQVGAAFCHTQLLGRRLQPVSFNESWASGQPRRVPPPAGADDRTMLWAISFERGDTLKTVFLGLFDGTVLGTDERSVPGNLAEPHKSDIQFGPLTITVSNGTALDVTLFINGIEAGVATAFGQLSADPTAFGESPWTVTTQTPSGRELTTGVLDPKQVWHNTGDYPLEGSSWARRQDLSCGPAGCLGRISAQRSSAFRELSAG